MTLIKSLFTAPAAAPPTQKQIATERAADVEISSQRGPGGFSSFLNPDDLIKRHGLDIYDKMMTDAQVRMAINYKRFAVVSCDWDILPASQSPADIETAALVKSSLENLSGSFIQSLFGITSALIHGYSVSEMIFSPSSTHPGKWALCAIRHKNPADFAFDTDRFGNITSLNLIDETGASIPLPQWKFAIYTYLPEYSRPWGRSDLRSVYKHWWSKDFLMKWWNIYLETFGAPTRIGKYPAGSTSASRQEDLKRVLRDIVNNTAITLPDDMDIEFVTAAGQAGFADAIEYHDRQIVKGILGQTLTSSEGMRSGSLALGSVHRETLDDFLSFLRVDIADSVINDQIVRRIVDFNFSDITAYPRFVWKPKRDNIRLESVSDIETLLRTGIATTADFPLLRDSLGLPA